MNDAANNIVMNMDSVDDVQITPEGTEEIRKDRKIKLAAALRLFGKLGFDEGVDSLCIPDSILPWACLSLDASYTVASIPPNGEATLEFDILVQADTSAPVVTFDLGGWPLLSASAWWTTDGDTTEVDLLMEPTFSLAADSGVTIVHCTWTPSCAVLG